MGIIILSNKLLILTPELEIAFDLLDIFTFTVYYYTLWAGHAEWNQDATQLASDDIEEDKSSLYLLEVYIFIIIIATFVISLIPPPMQDWELISALLRGNLVTV